MMSAAACNVLLQQFQTVVKSIYGSTITWSSFWKSWLVAQKSKVIVEVVVVFFYKHYFN